MTEAEEQQDPKTLETSSALKEWKEDFMALTKARLSGLVVFTTIFGLFVVTKGAGTFSWMLLFHTVFGTVLAAFGAAVFNQLMEVDADSRMRRTAERPLPRNRIPRAGAFIMGWLFSAFGIIHLGMKTNVTAGIVAAATLFVYLFVYTPLKRVSSTNTIVGAISGALPPLIGWAAGGGEILSLGAAYLFGFLFFWQLPHFAAINWMYRDEYRQGGFVMWSNEDESGRKTAKIALFFSVCVFLFAIGFAFTPVLATWYAGAGGALGAIMIWLAFVFFQKGERPAARSLFFFTLLYLPAAMVFSYFAWNQA